MSAEMTRHTARDWGPRNYPISHFLSSLLAAEVSQGSGFDWRLSWDQIEQEKPRQHGHQARLLSSQQKSLLKVAVYKNGLLHSKFKMFLLFHFNFFFLGVDTWKKGKGEKKSLSFLPPPSIPLPHTHLYLPWNHFVNTKKAPQAIGAQTLIFRVDNWLLSVDNS